MEDAEAVVEAVDSKRREARGSWKIPGDFSDVERNLSNTDGAFAKVVRGYGPLLSAWHEILRRSWRKTRYQGRIGAQRMH